MERKSSGLNVLLHSPHVLRIDSPDGVKDVIAVQRKFLKDKGCDVTIVGPRIRDIKNNLADFELGVGIKIGDAKTSLQTGWFATKKQARELAQEIRPDIVVMHEPLVVGTVGHSLISGMPRREDGESVPAIIGHFHAQNEHLSSRMKLVKKSMRFVRRPKFSSVGIPIGLTPGYVKTIVRALDGKIAVSNDTAIFWQTQIESYIREPLEEEFKVIYNAIDTLELTPDGKAIESWNDGRKTILAAARHDKRKGLEFGIMALGILVSQGRRDIKLMITGKGSETERLKALSEKLNLSDFVKFVGVLPREELVKAYRTADVFISPAIGDEGFGRTLAEALSSGTLVVASDIRGYREVMKNQPFTKPVIPQNPDALARGIVELLNLPNEEKIRLKKQARDHTIENFSMPVIANQTIEYFEKVLLVHRRPIKEDWDYKKKRKIPRFGIVFNADRKK